MTVQIGSDAEMARINGNSFGPGSQIQSEVVAQRQRDGYDLAGTHTRPVTAFALAGGAAVIAGFISQEHSAEIGLWVAGGFSYVVGALAVGHTVGDLQPERPQS